MRKCILACFTAPKSLKRCPPEDQQHGTLKVVELNQSEKRKNFEVFVTESKKEELLNSCSIGEKIEALDLNEKPHVEISSSVDSEIEKVESEVLILNEKEKEEKKDERTNEISKHSNHPNDRYQNCTRESDFEEIDAYVEEEEDSCESSSLFSLSIESRKHSFTSRRDEEDEEEEVQSSKRIRSCSGVLMEVNSPTMALKPKGRENQIAEVFSVLKPIDLNLRECKAIKGGNDTPLEEENDGEKENVNLGQGNEILQIPISEEPSFSVLSRNSKQQLEKPQKKAEDEEIAGAVDTSLSSWLKF